MNLILVGREPHPLDPRAIASKISHWIVDDSYALKQILNKAQQKTFLIVCRGSTSNLKREFLVSFPSLQINSIEKILIETSPRIKVKQTLPEDATTSNKEEKMKEKSARKSFHRNNQKILKQQIKQSEHSWCIRGKQKQNKTHRFR